MSPITPPMIRSSPGWDPRQARPRARPSAAARRDQHRRGRVHLPRRRITTAIIVGLVYDSLASAPAARVPYWSAQDTWARSGMASIAEATWAPFCFPLPATAPAAGRRGARSRGDYELARTPNGSTDSTRRRRSRACSTTSTRPINGERADYDQHRRLARRRHRRHIAAPGASRRRAARPGLWGEDVVMTVVPLDPGDRGAGSPRRTSRTVPVRGCRSSIGARRRTRSPSGRPWLPLPLVALPSVAPGRRARKADLWLARRSSAEHGRAPTRQGWPPDGRCLGAIVAPDTYKCARGLLARLPRLRRGSRCRSAGLRRRGPDLRATRPDRPLPRPLGHPSHPRHHPMAYHRDPSRHRQLLTLHHPGHDRAKNRRDWVSYQ